MDWIRKSPRTSTLILKPGAPSTHVSKHNIFSHQPTAQGRWGVSRLPDIGLGRHLLFGTNAWDALTLASDAVTLGSLRPDGQLPFPARRTASVNPVETLHAE